MDFILGYLNLNTLSYGELCVRIGLACLFGFLLGLDREKKDKPIDFRAFMIVCVATTLIAIMGQEIYHDYVSADDVAVLDLAKIISGALTGIGFLGAGAIIKREDTQVVGTATGACIWASGAMGLALGFGFYGLAIVTFAALFLILVIGGMFMEKSLGRKDNGKA